MNEIGRLLREGDPVARESFPAVEIDGMLGRLRGAAERRVLDMDVARAPWGAAWRVTATALACAAVILVAVLASDIPPVLDAGIGRQRGDRALAADPGVDRVRPQRVNQPAAAVMPVRQLQFSTPEGVRVFWTFNPDFQEN